MTLFQRILRGDLILRSPDDNVAPLADQNISTPQDSGTTPAVVETPVVEDAAADDAAEPANEAETVTRGQQQRIDTLTAQKWEERRRAAAAEQEATNLRNRLAQFERLGVDPSVIDQQPEQQQNNQNKPNAPLYTREQLEQRARELARVEATEMSFRSEIDKQANQTRQKFPDFDTSVNNLGKFGPLSRDFLSMVLEAGHDGPVSAGEVIYHLGKDLNEADRILSLPPQRQAVALARFANKLAPAERTADDETASALLSRAPAPISNRPAAVSRRSYDLNDPNMPIDQWMREREKQLAARQGR